MLIAQDKKKSNIAEYILYMWQIEDMLRALQLDMHLVDQHVISHFKTDEQTAKTMHDWYENLVEMMKNENVEKTGHLQIIKNNVNELSELHFFLLYKANDRRYQQIITMSAGNLVDFRKRTNVDNETGDVELALNALYGHLMLRLQKKEISSETTAAMESFSKMIAYLAAKYKQNEEEENKILS